MRLEDSLVHSNIEAIIALDARFRISLFNPAAETIFGYLAAEVLERPFDLIIHPHVADQLRERMRSAAAELAARGQANLSLEIVGRRKDGSEVPLEAIVSVVNSPDDQPHYVAFLRDISARKQVEDNLARSLSLVQATLDSTADGILVIDANRQVTIYNRKFVELWRIPTDIVASHDDRQLLAFVLDQLTDPAGFIAKVEEMYDRPDAESFDILEFPTAASSSAILNRSGSALK